MICELALGGWIVDPVVEAAALQRVVDFPSPVRGDDHDRRLFGLDRADLGDRDLEVRQHLEQIGLERLVGAIELVDQQNRRPRALLRLERLQERPVDQEALGEDVLGQRLAIAHALRLGHPDLEHLAGVVPLVDRRAHVQPLVALQPHEAPVQRLGQNLADLGLADARLALQEQRPSELKCEVQRGRKRPVGDVVAAHQERLGVVDGGDLGHRVRAV